MTSRLHDCALIVAAIGLVGLGWLIYQTGRAVVAALDAEEPLPPEWQNDSSPPRCLPPRRRHGAWREDCTR